jgi:hypothetical protein
MAEKTREHYKNGFEATRRNFSALAKRMRRGSMNSLAAEHIGAIRKTVLADCQLAEKEYRAYFEAGGDPDNEDYAQLVVLGPNILGNLQLIINNKTESIFGEN